MERIQAAIENLAINVNSVSEHLLVGGAQVRNESTPLAHFENPHATDDFQTERSRKLPRRVFIQHGKVRGKFLGEKDRRKLARAQPVLPLPFLHTHGARAGLNSNPSGALYGCRGRTSCTNHRSEEHTSELQS